MKRRWYEKHPVSHEAMEQWRVFPPALQRAIAREIYARTMELQMYNFFEKRLDKIPKPMAGIYLAFKRRRWYDRDPLIRKTVNVLPLLKQDELVSLCERILMIKIHIERSQVNLKGMSDDELDKLVEYVFKQPRGVFF